jgi:hypothetical protein
MSYSYSFIFNNNDLDFNNQIKNLLHFLSLNNVKNYYFDGNLYSKKPIHFKNTSYDDSIKYKEYMLKIVEDFIKINNQHKKIYKNYERITSLEMLPELNEDNKENLFFVKEWSEVVINNFDDEERKKYHENVENYKKLFLDSNILNILSNEDKKMIGKLFEKEKIAENIKENIIDNEIKILENIDNKIVEPSSFCFIGNSNSCFEVINMLVTLSEHHKNAKVYGLVDEKMREELKNNEHIELNFNLIDIKEIEQEEKLHNKFTIIKKALLEYGDTLFIEEDIFIFKKITLPYSSDINIGFSSYHINTYKEIIKGMFWCNNINCLYDIDEIYKSNIPLNILFNNLINKYSYNEFVIGNTFITWDVNDEINSKKVLDNNISLYDMVFPTENIMSKYNKQLFWQYPAITEKTFYIQNKDNNNLFSMPWATIIDKEYNLHNIYRLLRPIIIKNKPYFTCCQHIHFRKLIPLWKALNIVTVFTPHKIKNQNNIKGITIKSCPLYAVNVENEQFNKEFNNIDFLNNERQILYSFIGGYQPKEYLTKIRPSIFEMKHPENTVIKYTGEWHFNKLVYNEKQNHKLELNIDEKHTTLTSYYNNLLINSRYTLAPSGSGPNSIRFWEALAVGSIPVLLSDTLELPEHELWKDAIVIIKESEVNKLQEVLNNISSEKEKIMRENCIKIYNHFKNNFANKKNNKDKIRTALFIVGQKRSLIDKRMQEKLKESYKFFKGDIFFVLEENNDNIDLSNFNAREIIYYKYKSEPNKYIPGYILMSYGWYNCMSLIYKYEKINNYKYDIIYKTRPDLLLENYIPEILKYNDREITSELVRDKKIVWGETIGDYGTSLNEPEFAIKDTFNIITRNACESFFVNFFNSCLNRNKYYPNKFMANEAKLGYFLKLENVEKKKLNLKRSIVRMQREETTNGAKSLDDAIQDIIIENEINLNNI